MAVCCILESLQAAMRPRAFAVHTADVNSRMKTNREKDVRQREKRGGEPEDRARLIGCHALIESIKDGRRVAATLPERYFDNNTQVSDIRCWLAVHGDRRSSLHLQHLHRYR